MTRTLIALLLLVAAVSFGLGLTLPLLQVKKLYMFTETPSLIEIVSQMWADRDWLIMIAVAAFSIVFPMIKLAVVFVTAIAPSARLARSPISRFAGTLSKWSMMDVLLVALVIFAAKTSGLATAIAQPGLWFYAASALCGAFAAGLLKTSASRKR
ncbi:MAG: paraquat-inducible protein A [Pseudomonadota bacterium]